MQIVFTLLQAYMWAQWWRYIGARFKLIIDKNRKFMTMPFEYLEDKDAMDCYQKAGIYAEMFAAQSQYYVDAAS
ncbi:hypothetical protein [Butyrivibrio sp. VCD2006]|uniref:hypothetical protein n=1 Tax=Butyrivibrio sp. VCD2006 TaxID=1280664 RepID=UPI00047A9A83|nr:hypothetical protein [Butyrivibrio sp. VCD2006]